MVYYQEGGWDGGTDLVCDAGCEMLLGKDVAIPRGFLLCYTYLNDQLQGVAGIKGEN